MSHHPPDDVLLCCNDLVNATAEEHSDPLEVIEHYQLHCRAAAPGGGGAKVIIGSDLGRERGRSQGVKEQSSVCGGPPATPSSTVALAWTLSLAAALALASSAHPQSQPLAIQCLKTASCEDTASLSINSEPTVCVIKLVADLTDGGGGTSVMLS